jgi:hypothetical protein
MIAIEYDDGSGSHRLPADWWADVLLAATMGRDVVAFAPTLAAEAFFRKAQDSMGISAAVLRQPEELTRADLLLVRTPASMARHAWMRQAVARDGAGPTAWSIVTVVDESTVGRWISSLASLVTMPIYPWDAIVCSSHQVRRQVLWAFKAQMAQLQQRFGVGRVIVPRVEVVHPGPHLIRMDGPGAHVLAIIERDRQAEHVLLLIRDRDDEVLALRQALELLKGDGCELLDNLLVVQAGTQAQDLAVEGVRVVRLENVSPRLFASVCGHVDVVGLLPTLSTAQDAQDLLAAARGGAAIVASDLGLASDLCRFDDTVQVRPDAVGIKVPVWCAPAAIDGVLALLSGVSSEGGSAVEQLDREVAALTALDVRGLANALSMLLESPALREDLGKRAAVHAAQAGWDAGLRCFQAVHAKLREVAEAAVARQPREALPDPAYPDPLHIQEAAVTHTLQPDTRLALAEGIDAEEPTATIVKRAGLLFRASGITVSRVLPTHEELALVVERLRGLERQDWPGITARDAVAGVAPTRQVHVFRSLLWCVRIGLLRILKGPAAEAVARATPTNRDDLDDELEVERVRS